MKLAIVLSREDLNGLQFPVVVEMYDKVAGNGSSGRQRRAYVEEFDASERARVKKLYDTFYRWYLVTGTPESYVVSGTESLEFMRRVCNFFGSL